MNTQFFIPANRYNIMLNVTDACNLECRYCFVSQHPHFMSLEVAKDTVDFFNDIISKSDKNESNQKRNERRFNINFFGGEPTLCWDSIIVPLINYTEEKDYNIHFGMTSNCTLLDDEKIKFMKEHKMSLLFSIDGDKQTQDYNRPCHNHNISSFDMLEPNLDKIIKSFPDTTFRSTLIPETCQNMMSNILFAYSKGFRHYFACPDDFNQGWTEDAISKLEKEVYKVSLYFIDSFSSPEKQANRMKLSFLEKELRFVKEWKRKANENIVSKTAGSMCGLGKASFCVNWEGAIFGCQETPSYGYNDNHHYIGNIYTGYDKDKFDNLVNSYSEKEIIGEDPSLCSECTYRFLCNKGFCHANSYLRFGNENTKSRIRCIWDSLLIKYSLFIVDTLKENTLFQKEFKNIC